MSRESIKLVLVFACCMLTALPLIGEQDTRKARISLPSTKELPQSGIYSGLECHEGSTSIEAMRYAPYSVSNVSNLYYTSSHPGAFHYAIAFNDGFSLLEGAVELDDGSIWSVWYEDMYKTADWLATDAIVIMRNTALFSTYDYKLVNIETGDSLLVNLNMGPFYDSLYRHWVTAIDDYNRLVYLEDGSVWNISFFDASTMQQWSIGDTVIIGLSDSFFNSNFLLNVELMTYVHGNAYN